MNACSFHCSVFAHRMGMRRALSSCGSRLRRAARCAARFHRAGVLSVSKMRACTWHLAVESRRE
jgi:hypothetical protein